MPHPYKYAVFCLMLILAFAAPSTQAQTPQVTYQLETDESGDTKVYVARDQIVMKPGFVYSASGSNTFAAKIDAGILFIPDSNTYALPNGTITTDPTMGAVVGSIPGQFSVTPTGAATYMIPIACPSGINGMQPNISLVYNSQGGNGIAGWGWNLSGMSAITRTGKSHYHDNALAAVQLTTADNLMLDGQRLLLVSGTNLTNNAKYRTEIETYSDITYKSINGYVCFEVKTKDGVTMEYGSSADSYVEAFGESEALTWLLKKVTDSNGNYMVYTYDTDSNNIEFWLSKINYTGNANANVSPLHEIEFIYQSNRFDSHISYFAGSPVMKTLTLEKIIVKTDENILSEYSLSYAASDSFYTKLSKVNLSSNNERYHATIFDWDKLNSFETPDFDTHTNVLEAFTPGSMDNTMFMLDFNNDGYPDILRPLFSFSTSKYIGWELYRSSNEGQNFILDQDEEMNIPANFTYQLIPADINQDGMPDVIEIRGKPDSLYVIDILLNDNGELVRQYFNQTLIVPAGLYSTFSFECGDFNGDGEIELLKKETITIGSNDSGKLHLYKINLNTNLLDSMSTTTVSEKLSTTYTVDLNGNGIPEVYIAENGEVYEYSTTNNAFTELNFETDFSGPDLVFADINADGKTDVLVYGNPNWEIYLSTGNSFEYLPNCPLTRQRTKNSQYDLNYNDHYFFSDLNGDNLKDIVEIYPVGELFKVKVYYFNGKNFILGDYGYTESEGFYYISSFPSTLSPYQDLNGDGNCELIEMNASVTTMVIRSFTTNETERKISTITNGLNQKQTFVYKNMVDTTVYNYGELINTPDVIKSFLSVPVVGEVISDVEGVASFSTNYFYKGLRLHTKGKGMLGFEEFIEDNMSQNRKTTSKFGFNSTYFNTFPTEQIVSTSSGSPVSTTTLTNNVVSLGGKRIFPFVSPQTTTDHLTGLSEIKTISGFDNYGNPDTIKTFKGDLIEKQTMSYVQRGSWCPNKLQSITAVTTYDEQSETNQIEYHYDDVTGNLTKEIINPNNAEYKVTTEYKNFDAFGHPLTVEVKAKDASGTEQTRTSSMTYTLSGASKGRFITSRTNVLGDSTSYEWDEVRGLLMREITNGKTTRYNYDGFGRLKETRYPDGNRKASVLQWAGGGGPSGAVYYSYAQTSGSAPVTTWYDALGREIQKDTYGLNEQKISVSTEYYASGANKDRLYRVSEAYFEGDAKIWAETYSVYDPYGRPTTVATLMGNVTTSYSGLNTTVTTPENTTTTTLNNSGFVASSTVNQKTVSYTYYPSGLTKTATPQGGQSLSMEYNIQVKRTKLTDPDAGVIETKYNGFGELVEEKQKIHSDNFIVTSHHFEANTGRLNSIVRNGETTSYSYDTQNRVSSIQITGQHKQTFSYDAFDRVTNIREEIGTKVLDRGTEYDPLGRVRKETYPSGYYTVNTYDSDYGFLTEVKDKYGRQIWKAIHENARGQLTAVQRGGTTTKFGFDSRGLPTGIKASGIVNLNYDFGNDGNLNYRIDSLMGQKEVFLFDGMNRLTNWNVYQNDVLVKPNNMVFNPNTGTITSKSDLDNLTMLYGENGKPHALTGIDGVPANFPADSLNVTYTDFKKIKTLTEGNKHYILAYGIDDQRRKSEYKINGVMQKTKYYLGDYEEETDNLGNIKKIHYLSGGAILIITNGVETLYYGYSDYQGNLIALASEAGTVVERYAYDPWGKRRNPSDWTQNDTRTSWIVSRGYTMHEHLDMFGIINMNGRVYDPLTAMFFSPDPYIQNPGNWLNYNRYTYVINNPFKYTDPDGEIIFTLICIFVPGMQVFLPIAVATDAAWMSEYASQVTKNHLVSKDMNYTSKDIWFGKIDWFDVGFSGIAGGLSTAFPVAAPWIKYGSPVIKNAVDITGDGDIETIFGGKRKDGGDGTKSLGMFLANTLLEVGSIAATDLANNYFNNTPSNFPKDISKNTPKSDLFDMSMKELLNKTSWDFMSSIMTTFSQQGFSMKYDQYQQQQLQNSNNFYLPTSPNRYKYNDYSPYDYSPYDYYMKNKIKLSHNKTSKNFLSIKLSSR